MPVWTFTSGPNKVRRALGGPPPPQAPPPAPDLTPTVSTFLCDSGQKL